MKSVNIVIDSSIRLNPKDLPKNVLDEIFNQLRVVNPQKKIAECEMLWNADDIPSHMELWKFNGYNELILPRGFLATLNIILYNNDIKVSSLDNTESDDNYLYDIPEINLRVYQNKAVADLIANEHGIYKAPTGSGKTRVMLEVAREYHQKTLVICEKSDILSQWEASAIDLHFRDVGTIGRGTWFEGPDIVFALRQSLINRSDLDQEWFNQWGTVIVDECHHCSADTMFELLQRFPARYRYGCSATPDSDPDLFPIARAVIGPVVHETKIEEIEEHLVIPSVKVVKTEFEFPYRPTFVGSKGRVVRNNYNDMMATLEEDRDRNIEIMSKVHNCAQAQRTCLVVSKRKKHLDNLYKIWKSMMESSPFNYDIFFLTGDNSKEFSDIKEKIELCYGCIILSTLADEGTDIPRLDRLFLAYPGRKLRGFEQSIGRIMRPHPKKKDAIIYDFRDYKVPLLNSQYRTRVQGIYNKKGYKVETIND